MKKKLFLEILFSFIIISCTPRAFAFNAYLLQNANDAENLRWDLIKNAKNQILISYYIFQDDLIGLTILNECLSAKKNNPSLDIKILMDGSANYVDKKILNYFIKKGLEIKEFHPLPKLFPGLKNIKPLRFFKALSQINQRMHDKLLLVDGEHLIVGGRNMQQEYFNYQTENRNFYDLDLYVNALSTGNDARQYFLALWNSEHIYPLTFKNKHIVTDENSIAEVEDKIKTILLAKTENESKVTTLKQIPLDDSSYAKFYHSYDFKKKKLSPLQMAETFFSRIVDVAEREVVIETPYFLPTKYFYRMFRKLKRKNVSLSVITNSYCTNDMDVAAGAYELRKKKILRSGIKLFEYQGDNYLHAKALTIDDTNTFVGTFNLDPRSTYINTEMVLEVMDKDITLNLNNKFTIDLSSSLEIKLDEKGRSPKPNKNCKKSKLQKFTYLVGMYGSLFPILYMQL